MPKGLKDYGVYKGKVDAFKDTVVRNHFQVKVGYGSNENYHRVCINVRSKVKDSPDLLYFLDQDFRHSIIKKLITFPNGFTLLEKTSASGSLDYIKGKLFPILDMKVIPTSLPGPNNDLVDIIHFYINKAKQEQADLYAFGQRWFTPNSSDKDFPEIPDQGIHDIHMNQGNDGSFEKDNGIWQDGGFFLHFTEPEKWVALFLRFQTQSIDIDDLDPISIVAALVNPKSKNDQGHEKVLLFNPTEKDISIDGWSIADKANRKEMLAGIIQSGSAITIGLSGKTAQLGNNGGIISLLNQNGTEISGVSYTSKEANQPGRWVQFR